jgi:hypothetical protein
MSWRDRQKANSLYQTHDSYEPLDLWEAWATVLTGPYGDKLIYSLSQEQEKPYHKVEQPLNQNEALFREGKRDLVNAILNMADRYKTKEKNDGTNTGSSTGTSARGSRHSTSRTI